MTTTSSKAKEATVRALEHFARCERELRDAEAAYLTARAKPWPGNVAMTRASLCTALAARDNADEHLRECEAAEAPFPVVYSKALHDWKAFGPVGWKCTLCGADFLGAVPPEDHCQLKAR